MVFHKVYFLKGQFYNWLNISKNLSEINELDWNLYFEYDEIPAYIVRYFDSNEPYIIFYKADEKYVYIYRILYGSRYYIRVLFGDIG